MRYEVDLAWETPGRKVTSVPVSGVFYSIKEALENAHKALKKKTFGRKIRSVTIVVKEAGR